MGRTGKCLLLSAHDGLIDRRIIGQANALAESGRQVTLVSVPAEGKELLDPRVRVVMATGGSDGLVRRVYRRIPRQVREPIRDVIRIVRPAPIRDFAGYFESLTPADDYDAIHCHDLQTLPAGMTIRAKVASQAKVIYDSHELFPCQFPAGRLKDYWADLERRHIGQADAVITVNESLAEEMEREYGIRRPAVLYNTCHFEMCGVSEESFLDHFGLPAGTNGFRFVFQGGFAREKNVEAMVRAFAVLGQPYRLFLLGGGEMEKRLRKIAAANVHFGAWVPGDRLLGYVARANAGIIPYLAGGLLNNYYCTPNKLFEYMQAGVPICAADLPELKRIVATEQIGRIYPMGTAEQIAAAIADFAPRCKAGEFVNWSFEAAREKYSWARQVGRLFSLYAELGV